MKIGKSALSSMEAMFFGDTQAWFEKNWKDGLKSASRVGVFSSALTVWLMVAARFRERHSLSAAIDVLREGGADLHLGENSGSKRVREKRISANTGGFSRARTRLPVDKVSNLVDVVNDALIERANPKGSNEDGNVYILDGTHILLQREPQIVKAFPLGRNQRGKMQLPQILMVVAHELYSGVAVRPEWGAFQGPPKPANEHDLGRRVMERLEKGSLIMGDRNFGVFPVVYHAQQSGHEVLVRLSSIQANRFLQGMKKDKDLDEQVTWSISTTGVKKHKLASDTAVKGRFIRKTINYAGFRPFVLYLFTTSNRSAESLAALYQRRVTIETDIRDLKHVINMEMIYAKSVEMISKELLLGVAAYNLARTILAVGARQIGLEPREISFTRAFSLAVILGRQLLKASDEAEVKKLWDDFLIALRQVKLPKRRNNRSEPRKIVKPPKQYTLLRYSRDDERQFQLKKLIP